MKEFFFASKDYRKLILKLLATHPSGERGQRKALAKSIGCSLPYLSNVLNNQNHLSPEQAELLAQYFSFSEKETRYFLCLLASERAGTLSLRKHYERELLLIRKEQSELTEQLAMNNDLSSDDKATYYSHWTYQALHVLCGIEEFREVKSISSKLSLPIKKTQNILEFLARVGLIEKQGFKYFRSTHQIHLERESPQSIGFHSSWRNKVSDDLVKSGDDELHYSLCFSCSNDDFEKVKEELVSSLKNSTSIIKQSKDRILGALCMDLIKL